MSSILAEIHAYWQSTAALDAALSHNRVWTGLAPESIAFPYACVIPLSMDQQFVTGVGYVETFQFQISIFDTNPDSCESIANTVAAQFDYKTISANTISCERVSGPFLVVDPDTPERVYHAVIVYDLLENKIMGVSS